MGAKPRGCNSNGTIEKYIILLNRLLNIHTDRKTCKKIYKVDRWIDMYIKWMSDIQVDGMNRQTFR